MLGTETTGEVTDWNARDTVRVRAEPDCVSSLHVLRRVSSGFRWERVAQALRDVSRAKRAGGVRRGGGNYAAVTQRRIDFDRNVRVSGRIQSGGGRGEASGAVDAEEIRVGEVRRDGGGFENEEEKEHIKGGGE